MKIVGISCSPRKGKTTTQALEIALEAARGAVSGMETELFELGGKTIGGCIACGKCSKKPECSQKDDFTELIQILSADDIVGIIVATPVYFQNMSSQCKAFFDRAVLFRRNGFMFRDKVGGAIAVGAMRNGGQELTLQAIHAAMLCHDMLVVSDGKPTAHLGGGLVSGKDNSITDDTFGIGTAKGVGVRVAEVAAKFVG